MIASGSDLIGVLVGVVLTLLVFSYLLGDNPLYRLAVHLFVGVAAGLVAAVAVRNVILPQLITPLFDIFGSGGSLQALLSLIPAGLAILLLAKLSRRLRKVGNVAMAFLVGVGAAAAIGGGILGTLFPQIGMTTDLFNLQTIVVNTPWDAPVEGLRRLVVVAGTAATLIFFHFGTLSAPESNRLRPQWLEGIAKTGHVFISITFGSLFAGVFAASLTAFIERWNFILSLFIP